MNFLLARIATANNEKMKPAPGNGNPEEDDADQLLWKSASDHESPADVHVATAEIAPAATLET